MPPGARSVPRPPPPGAVLDCGAVHTYVGSVCFKTGPPGLVGAELEWLVVDRDDPTAVVPLPALRAVVAAAGPPPHRSRVTYEPGGQVELSSLAHRGTRACWTALTEDTDHLARALAPAGLALLPTALDPFRAPRRQLVHPRYDAMAAYFDAAGGDTARYGPVMMTGTASTQVNLDCGRDPDDALRRWRVLHAVGPAMVAACANSPVHAGRPTGWVSGRQQVWQHLDPQRTAPVAGEDPAAAWAGYALDARVMMTRHDRTVGGTPRGLTLRRWLTGDRGGLPAADEEDLAGHLTTLFPPVRPRGWFEVRYLDALPARWWPVPVAVLAALVDDPRASAAATEACVAAGDWGLAGRVGLGDPTVHAAAVATFDAALAAMVRAREDAGLVALVSDYHDTYVRPGRCPADDPLEL